MNECHFSRGHLSKSNMLHTGYLTPGARSMTVACRPFEEKNNLEAVIARGRCRSVDLHLGAVAAMGFH